MRKVLYFAALIPLTALAQPLTPTNNPNQPNYVNPSQQRMQNEMRSEQIQQQGTLKQQRQMQSQAQQQRLQSQLQENQQRVIRSQPGGQMMPGNNGGGLQRSPQPMSSEQR